MTSRPPERIPEEKVATILARAAELDRDAREMVDLDAIRTAALEAGISLKAVDAALAEYATGAVPAAAPQPDREEAPRWKRALRRLVSPVAHGLAALALGSFIGAAGAGNEPLIVGGYVAFFYAVWRLIRKHRPTRTVWVYQLAVAFTTFAGILGFSGAGGDGEVAAVFAVVGAALFVAGSLVIKVRLRWRRRPASGRELPGRVS